MRALFLLLAIGLSSTAAAQAGMESLLERLKSPKGATAAQCEAQVARAATLNGPDLLYGASVCHAANRPEQGNFLLIAGQVRSSADMAETVPARKADYNAQSTLYGIIYFHAGGPGKAEVLRDPASRERFFRLFDSWSPRYDPDYEPGWKVRSGAVPAAYQAAMAALKAARRKQLVDVARLYSDDQYYALHRRFQDLQARNPNGLVEGTADAALAQDLQRRMSERSEALGVATFAGDEGGDPGGERFPPAAPASDEAVLAGKADPVVQRCAGLAEKLAIASDSRIVRVVITRSADWGTIWRADLAAAARPMERFTCTENTSASRPLEMGDESIAPLAEAVAPPAGGR
jgi:hypothetical protein